MSFVSLPEDAVEKTLVDEAGQSAVFHIKSVLSKGDVNHAFQVVMESTRDMARSDRPIEVSSDNQPQQLNLDMVLGLPVGQLAILKRAIVGWDLKYPKGHPDYPTPIEVSEENIERLANPVVDELCDFIRELNRVKTREETKNLGKN